MPNKHPYTIIKQLDDRVTATFSFESDQPLTGTSTFTGPIKISLTSEPTSYSIFEGDATVNPTENHVLLKRGTRKIYTIEHVLLRSMTGTFNQVLQLDSVMTHPTTGPTDALEIFMPNGALKEKLLGLFVNGMITRGVHLLFHRASNETLAFSTSCYDGKFTKDSAVNVYHDPEGIFIIKHADGTLTASQGFQLGVASSYAFIIDMHHKQISAIHFKILKYQHIIWSARLTGPNHFDITCTNAYLLNKEMIKRTILSFMNLLSILGEMPAPQGIDVNITPVPILNNQHYTKPVLMLDNRLGELVEGQCDGFGCVNGYAIVENIRLDHQTVMYKKGLFSEHKFLSGEIGYFNNEHLIKTYTIAPKEDHVPQRATCITTLADGSEFSVEGMVTQDDENVFEFCALPAGTVSKQSISSAHHCSTYEGQTCNGEPHGLGKQIKTETHDGRKKHETQIGPFQDGRLGQDGTIECTEEDQTQTIVTTRHIESKLEVMGGDSSYSGTEHTTTTFKDQAEVGYEETAIGKFTNQRLTAGRLKRLYFDETAIHTEEEGTFNDRRELNGKDCGRAFFTMMCETRHERAIQKGCFTNGVLTSGQQILFSANVTASYQGKFAPPQTPACNPVEDLNKKYHDPNGILMIRNDASKTIIWEKNFQDGRSTTPPYHITLNDKHQWITITLPNHFVMARDENGDTALNILDPAFKKLSPKDKSKKETQYNTTCKSIETTLLEQHMVSPFQPLVVPSLLELAEAEEASKTEKKKQKNADKQLQKQQEQDQQQSKQKKQQVKADQKAQKKRAEQEEKAQALKAQQELAETRRVKRLTDSLQQEMSSATPPESYAGQTPEESQGSLQQSSPSASLPSTAATVATPTPTFTTTSPTHTPTPPPSHPNIEVDASPILEAFAQKFGRDPTYLTAVVNDDANHQHTVRKWIQGRKQWPEFVYTVEDYNKVTGIRFDYHVLSHTCLLKNEEFEGQAILTLWNIHMNQVLSSYELSGKFLCTEHCEAPLVYRANFIFLSGSCTTTNFITQVSTEADEPTAVTEQTAFSVVKLPHERAKSPLRFFKAESGAEPTDPVVKTTAASARPC